MRGRGGTLESLILGLSAVMIWAAGPMIPDYKKRHELGGFAKLLKANAVLF